MPTEKESAQAAADYITDMVNDYDFPTVIGMMEAVSILQGKMRILR